MPIYGEPLPPYPERYRKGGWLFNQRYFFECHEILEVLWKESIGTPKTFYQMLIHAAVCFVHWENANRKGVLSLQHTFKGKAGQIPADRYLGLDIFSLKAGMARLVEPLRADPALPLPPLETVDLPTLAVSNFEPTEVGEHELRVLSRELKEEE